MTNKRSSSLISSNRAYPIYKCAINSPKINFILESYYNTIVKVKFYSTRWLKILDVMIEKGKSPTIGKLRTIQLIEKDIELLIRVFELLRNAGKTKTNNILSKSNFGSRKKYSIESAILDKK